MMKQLKHLTLGLCLLGSGLAMTSCLGGDSDPYNYGSGIVKVGGIMGITQFYTPGQRMTITPTSTSIAAAESNGGFSFRNIDGQIGILQYAWNPEDGIATVTETQADQVTLSAFVSLDGPVLTVSAADKGTERDSVATHPIIALNPMVSGLTYKPYFFDDTKQDVVCLFDYYVPDIYSATTGSFTLVYYPEDPDTKAAMEEGTLRLHLNYRLHMRNDNNVYNSSTHAIDTRNPTYYYRAFRLSRLGIPSTSYQNVEIVAKENTLNTDINDANNTKENVYPVLTLDEYEDELGVQ